VTTPRTVRILGTHGVPAGYGGFETAAQEVGLFLARQGWRVVIYCQVQGRGPITEDTWNGLERVIIPIPTEGWRGTSRFDLVSIRHALKHRDLCLTFGYNTGLFQTLLRVRRVPNVVNMDGIEWSRKRWGWPRQAILYVNERIAAVVGNHLIADHPEIERYLETRAPKRKITTITYGADAVTSAPTDKAEALGVVPGRYSTVVCRPIPENSILELVEGFSAKRRGHQLVVVGDYEPSEDEYHRAVLDAASDEVVFPGAIYDKETLAAVRFHGTLYLHGNTVGGTNPSLVEAMAAGNAVIAHDNPYNRWVARDGARYFQTADDVSELLTELLDEPAAVAELQAAAQRRHAEEFTWEHVAGQYEELLLRYHPEAA
jgi:glycosyltransferase involved in cell wall biosynthesis